MAFGSCKNCERLQAQNDKLLEAVLSMRMNGGVMPQPARITPPAMPPEERAVIRAHDEFVEEAAKHIATITGQPIERARQEAERFRREIDAPISLP